MRYFFLLALALLIPSVIFSQPNLSQASVFNIGETYTLRPIDTVGITEGDGGVGKTWDFSYVSVMHGAEFEQTIKIVEPSKGFQSNKFSGASYAFQNDNSYTYYKYNGNNIERLGVGYNDGYELLNNSQLTSKFPFTYKDEFVDTFSGVILTNVDGQDIQMRRGGTSKITSDGFGKLILPSGVYDDLLRIKITQTLLDTMNAEIPGNPPIVIRTEIEDYIWQNDNYKVPVFHISYVTTIQKAMGHEIKNTTKNIFVLGESHESIEHTLSAPIIVAPLKDSKVKAPFDIEWTEAILQGIKDSDSFTNDLIEYHLELSTDPSFIQSEAIRAYFAGNNTYYTVTDDFDSDMIYIRVRAVAGEVESEWSEPRMVQYDDGNPDLLPTPIQIFPKNDATDVSLSPTFAWSGNEDAVELVVYNDDGDYMNFKGDNSGSYQFDNDFRPNTTYYWVVRQISYGFAGVDSSAWSPVWTFTTGDDDDDNNGNTIAKPMLIYPNNEAEEVYFTPLMFIWLAEEAYVELDIYNDNGYHYNLDMPNDGQYEFTELQPKTTYYWRLRQYNDEGQYSEWSDVFSFTTDKETSVRDISTFPIHNIEVYPNPTVGNAVINYNVNIPQEYVLYFEDLNGKTIFKQSLGMISEGNHTLSLDLSQYARGNYFITIKGNQCSASRNVILE